MLDSQALIEVCRTTATITKFVTGGGLEQTILSISGDVHSESAALALRNVDRASDPRALVWVAVGHLQSAHVSYRKIWQKYFESTVGGINRQGSALEAAHKDIEICYLLGICYIYLVEKDAAWGVSGLIQDAWNVASPTTYTARDVVSATLSALNPFEIKVWRRYKKPDIMVWGEIIKAIKQLP